MDDVAQPQDNPYTFDQGACQSCRGTCCRGSGGYVWVTVQEMEDLAAYKKMDLETFSNTYLRAVQGRLSLQEGVSNAEHLCCFILMPLTSNAPSIQPCRPSAGRIPFGAFTATIPSGSIRPARGFKLSLFLDPQKKNNINPYAVVSLE